MKEYALFLDRFFSSNAAKSATAHDWRQSSTNSTSDERLLSVPSERGMPMECLVLGPWWWGIQWRSTEWGDLARDAGLLLPSNSDGTL